MILDLVDVNGQIYPLREAPIYINDLAFMRAYGIFDFCHLAHGSVVFGDAYWQRFITSAAECNIPIVLEKEELWSRIRKLCETNNMFDGYVKFIYTAGHSSNGHDPDGRPNLVLLLYTAYHNPPAAEGYALRLDRFTRIPSQAKTIDYANSLRQFKSLKAQGFLDVLYHDGTYITESARANFFAVDANGTLRTNPNAVLEGITRKQLLQIAAHVIDVDLRPISIGELPFVQEAFITSTTKYLFPITRINDLMIGHGNIGQQSQRLYDLLAAHYSTEKQRLSSRNA